jgi:hypothetical protein
MVILKEKHHKFKTWPSKKAFTKTNHFPPCVEIIICYLDDMQMLVKNIFNIIGVMNSKIKVIAPKSQH